MLQNKIAVILNCALAVLGLAGNSANADEQQQRGQAIYEEHCHMCHALHDPGEFTADKWQKKLPLMEPMAKITDEADKAALSAYLNANAGSKESILTEEKGYFSQHCGSCHDADKPMSTDMDLEDMMEFVEEHMEEQDQDELDEKDLHEASEYLLHSQQWHQQ